MKPRVDYSLYLCTDRALMSSATLAQNVRSAIEGGVSVVQLREKDCSSRTFYDLALSVKAVTDAYHVPLIINDRVDIALAVGADGVHIGQSDLPLTAVRALVGDRMLIGVSASNVQQAVQAERQGADYLGVGAMFATQTKADATAVSIDELKRIRQAVQLPIVAIGGINQQTLPRLYGTGIDGVAVVSAIVAQADVRAAASALRALWRAHQGES